MKILNLLVIDDQPDEDTIDKLKDELKGDGIDIRYEIFNPKSKYFEDDDEKFNPTHFYKTIKTHLRSTHVYLIACDYTLGVIDGIDVSHKIRHEFHFKGITILFSTKLATIISDIITSKEEKEKEKKEKEDKESKDKEDSDKTKLIQRLIASHITEFPSRKELDNVLKGYFRKPLGKLDMKQEILTWLNSFDAYQFKAIYPMFKDLTFAEIAEHIGDETDEGIEYCYEIIENAISLMIDLNNLPKR
jgi:CheY-like chemotaxis protein